MWSGDYLKQRLPEYMLPAAFVLGAIVAPPDSVAAVAVMRPLRTPAALTAVLEGEGEGS